MVLYICEDIIKSLGNPANANYIHAVRIFNEVSLAALRGKHYVLIENFLDRKIQNIIRDISPERNFLCLKKSNTSQDISILSLVDIILVISFFKIERLKKLSWYVNQKLLGLNPSENSKLEVYEETHLLTENFNDGRLFNEITYRYMKNNKISPKLQLSFFNRLGGGVTISDVYNQEKNSGSHLCITIIDSDKKHPTGDEGSTAKGFRKHLNKKWTYSGHHIMKDLSEIENLLPVMFYKNKSNGNLIKRLSKIDLSFYDLKCGLTAGILKDIDGYNHWSNHGVTLPAIEDIRKMDNKQQLMQGVGDQAMTSFLNKKGYKALIIGIKERDLSENQRNEHKAIAKLIFNWCVSSHPPRL